MQEPPQSSRPQKGDMKFPTEHPKIFGGTFKNLIATATRLQGFGHSWAEHCVRLAQVFTCI